MVRATGMLMMASRLRVLIPAALLTLLQTQLPANDAIEALGEHGRKLLLAGNWQAAGEHYGRRQHWLRQDFEEVWRSELEGDEQAQARFRYRLLNVLFWHSGDSYGWTNGWTDLERHGDAYLELVGKLPVGEGEGALDLSHLGLLKEVAERGRRGELTEHDHARIVSAIRQSPDSLPAVVAYMVLVETRRHTEKEAVLWEEARELPWGKYGKLTLAREAQCAVSRIDRRLLRSILREGWELAPSNEEKASLLKSLSKTQWDIARAHRVGLQTALGYAEKVYRDFPGTAGAREARLLAVKMLLEKFGPERAVALVREFQREKPEPAGVARAVFEIARRARWDKDYDTAKRLLVEIVQRYPREGVAAEAMGELASICRAAGREAEHVRWLKQLASFVVPEEFCVAALKARMARADAFRHLADYYHARGNWEEAMSWWERYEPAGWCGYGNEQMLARRAYRIAVCQMNLGRTDDAVKTMEEWLLTVTEHCELGLARMYVDYQLDKIGGQGLHRRLEGLLAENPYRYPARIALEYLKMLDLAAAGKLEDLWDYLEGRPLDPHGEEGWKVELAADVLVSMPQVTEPLARVKLAGGPQDEAWACVLLARMKAPGIVHILSECIERKDGPYGLEGYFYALALVATDEAYAVITHYAEQQDDPRQRAAERVLKRYPGAIEEKSGAVR